MLGLDNPLHIAIVLLVVLLVFGAKRLPEMGKSMGEGLRGFKSSLSGEGDDPGHHTSDLLTPATTAPATTAPTMPEPVMTERPAPVADRTPAQPAG